MTSPVKKRIFLPKNDPIWPEIGFFLSIAGSFGALLVGRLVVVARGLYLARHLFTLFSYLPIWLIRFAIQNLVLTDFGKKKKKVHFKHNPEEIKASHFNVQCLMFKNTPCGIVDTCFPSFQFHPQLPCARVAHSVVVVIPESRFPYQ